MAITVTSFQEPAPRNRFVVWLMRRGIRKIVMTVGLTLFTIWTLFPFLWIVATSIKPNRDIYRNVRLIPDRVTSEHYSEVLNHTPFWTFFRNSLQVAALTTVIAMVTAVLAAYALTRLAFRGRTILARATIVTYLVPAALLFIPLFQLANQLHLTDKSTGLVVIYLIFTVPFSTWLAISYFNTIPAELEDAALVDGANRLQSLITIVIPLALPALAVIALFTFTLAWNEFLFAMLLIGRDSQKTLPVGLSDFVKGDVFQWGPLMAASLMASVPPVAIYLLAQRWVVSGLSGGALKG